MQKKKFGTPEIVEKFKSVFKLCGLWPTEIPSSECPSILYTLYGVTLIFIFLFLYDLSLSLNVFFVEDVQDATYNLCMSLTVVALFGKVLNHVICLRKIRKTLRTSEEFEFENAGEIMFFDQRMSLFNKLSKFLFLSANSAGLCNCVAAIMSEEVRLIYLAWYPFDWKSNLTTYAFVYAYQAIGMTIQANLNVSMDLFATYLTYAASIKLEILGTRLENLGKVGGEFQLNEQSYNNALVQCVIVYQRIRKYTDDLQKCFAYGFMVQISFSAAVICSIAYQLTITSFKENVAAYSFLVMFQLCIIIQAAIPCYFGNEIILKHEHLTRSIFECGWHLRSMRYRRIVIVLLEIVKRQRSILIGNWFVLDLNLFVSIMKLAYRLYTLLA